MNELQEMQERMAQLEQETLELKQETLVLKSKGKTQAIRQRFLFALAVIGVGMAFMTHKGYTQTTESGVLICKQIKIIDANRVTRMTLGTTSDSEGIISVYNGQNRKVITISATVSTGAGLITVNDEQGRMMAQMSSKEGKGILWSQK